eukprot:8212027-Pyramimonas_sp.AAC.1
MVALQPPGTRGTSCSSASVPGVAPRRPSAAVSAAPGLTSDAACALASGRDGKVSPPVCLVFSFAGGAACPCLPVVRLAWCACVPKDYCIPTSLSSARPALACAAFDSSSRARVPKSIPTSPVRNVAHES